MRIVKRYSHLNGEEYLLVHQPELYEEVQEAIAAVDAEACRTKKSREKTKLGRTLYDPGALNKAFKAEFEAKGWSAVTRYFCVSDEYDVVRSIELLPYDEQKQVLEDLGKPLYRSYNQTDFVKDQIAVEVQLGKYFAVTYDLFVKHLSFYTGGLINVGIEIVPSRELQQNMSSGVPWYEKEVHNVLRHGRTTPPVPVVIIGIAP